MDSITIPSRLAIRCLRAELIAPRDRARIEREMTQLGVRLGRAVDDTIIVIDTRIARPWATIAAALARTHATDVIVPDLEHVDGLEIAIRERAQLITVAGERVLERAHLGIPA